ncbi:MAG: hypothetical protein GTO14_21175 [Anaerolineales bacterium]|nr:hypothetical protein [Anaerolineales bacterium]
MKHLNPEKLHTRLEANIDKDRPIHPRRYTLTHSDLTGDIFLTIGSTYNRKQISSLYTRFMRDEVLASWDQGENGPVLRVHCHVSGGLVFGSPSFRDAIFRRHMPLVLEAFRYGDRGLWEANPHLDRAPIIVNFAARQERYNRNEYWGLCEDYR